MKNAHASPTTAVLVGRRRRSRLTRTARAIGTAAAATTPAPVTDHATPTSSPTAATRRTCTTIVDAFEKANPDITVEVDDAALRRLLHRAADRPRGGHARLTSSTRLRELRDSTRPTASLGRARAVVDAAAYKPSLLEAYSIDGKQYALPTSFSDVVLYYNKDLFDAAGVANPTADWTWADEKAAAEKLTDKAAGVWGDYQPISFYEYYKALAQTGGEFLNADGKTAVTFNSPEGIAAANGSSSKSGTVDADRRGRRRARPTSTPTCSRPASSRCGTPASGCSARSPTCPSTGTSRSSRATPQQASAVFSNARRASRRLEAAGGRVRSGPSS